MRNSRKGIPFVGTQATSPVDTHRSENKGLQLQPALLVGLSTAAAPVHNAGQGVHGVTVEQQVQSHQIGFAILALLVVEAGVA